MGIDDWGWGLGLIPDNQSPIKNVFIYKKEYIFEKNVIITKN